MDEKDEIKALKELVQKLHRPVMALTVLTAISTAAALSNILFGWDGLIY